MNANTSRKTIHFSDNMEAKDENALSSRLRALIRKKRDENVSTFPAKKDQRKNIGCLRKNCLKTFLNSYQHITVPVTCKVKAAPDFPCPGDHLTEFVLLYYQKYSF